MTQLLQIGAHVERLATGAIWSEGPVWLPDRSRVLWSDIPADRVLEWHAATGEVTVYAQPAGHTNGRTLDLEGHVVQCSHGRRRVEREVDGLVTAVAERWDGRRFNSPNDVVVASDGAVWFTDPPYGIHPSGREGHPGEQEYGGCFVFRTDAVTGETVPVVTDMVHPNGLAFSPDERTLYVADTGFLQIESAPRAVRAYPVDGVTAGDGRDLFAALPGATDGLRVDEAGRIWSSSDDAVQVFSAEGERLLAIPVPERVSNLCFGGDDGHDLFITATTSLYRVRTTTSDAAAR